MKTLKSTLARFQIIAVTVSSLCLTCCNSSDHGPDVQITVSRPNLDESTFGGYTDTVTIQSNVPWKIITTNSAWLQVDNLQGNAGKTILHLNVLSSAQSTRVATLQVTPSSASTPSVSIVATQKMYQTTWAKSFGGSNVDYALSILSTSDGGFLAAGFTASNDGDVTGSHGSYDYWVLKLDGGGSKVWEKAFGGYYSDVASSVIATSDGGYAIAGFSQSKDGDVTGNQGGNDYWVVKLDASGNKVWGKTFGGTGDDYAASIVATADGGYLIAGSTTSVDGDITGNHGSYDYWVVKLDGSGNKVWAESFGGSAEDRASSIVATSDQGFVIAGYSYSNDGDVSGNHGGDDYWIVKLDKNGNKVWAKCFGGSLYEEANSIVSTKDGGFAIAGTSSSNDGDVTGSHGFVDYLVMKLDAGGNKLWTKLLGGTGGEYAQTIITTRDEGFAIAGYSSSYDGDVIGNHGNNDYWITKLDGNGNKVWVKSLGGTGYDYGYSIIATIDGGFAIAGSSSSNDWDVTGNHGGSPDYWLLKLN